MDVRTGTGGSRPSRRAATRVCCRGTSPVRQGWLALLLASLVPLLQERADAYPMPPDFYELSGEYVSWHIPWAKPLDGGPIKALVVAPRGAQRETLELAQRLELDYTYVLALTPTELGWSSKSSSYAPADGASNTDVLAELSAKLEADYDVIIIGHLDWNVFPSRLLYAILKKVRDGTGLVYAHSSFGRVKWLNVALEKARKDPEATARVAAAVPFAAIPGVDASGAEDVLTCARLGEGRIVTLDYPGKRPRFQFLTPLVSDEVESFADGHYEYAMSLVVRSVIWSAGREPDWRIDAWGSNGAVFPRSALPGRNLRAVLVGASPAHELEAEMTVRTADGTPVLSQAVAVTEFRDRAEIEMPLAALPRGRYFADLQLRRDGRNIDWSTTFFDVTTEVDIASVETDRTWYETGQTVSAEVTLSTPLPRARVRLRVDLVDSLGRLLATQRLKPERGTRRAACRFELHDPLTITAVVRAVLSEDDDILAEKEQAVSIVRREWDDFRFCVWTAGTNFSEKVRRIMFTQLRRAGVDTFTNSSTSEVNARRSAQLGFHGIPYMTRYSYSGSELVRKPCLTEPTFLKQHLQGLRDVARVQRPYDPLGYTLGDECFLARGRTDVCFSPSCIADLREWLKTEYASVGELNQSWGTTYASFAEAEPITLADAKAQGQIPRWVDHRRHMEHVYARMMARAREAIKEEDPNARVGFDGPFNTVSCSGNDWWRLMQEFDLCNVYFHEPDEWEAVRSFAKPGTLLGLWYGGYTNQRNEDYSRFFPWRAVLNGFNSVWWYAVYHGLAACPMDALTPSMTWYGYFAASVQEVQELKAGVGKALMHAERLHDGIAVHYSQSSLHAASAYEGTGNLHQTWRQWYALLEDMGLQYECLSYARIEAEGVDASEYRVLVLPYSQAVSPREAEAVRQFVASGGTVVADLRPGLADQHGKLVTPGLLDDVFGVRRRSGGMKLNAGVDATLVAAIGAAAANTALRGLTVDPEVEPNGASHLGSADATPILLTHRFGKGRALLLNFSLSGYNAARATAEARTYWSVLLGLLAEAGVEPRARVNGADGPLHKLESVFFHDGSVEYLGFLKYRTGPDDGTISAQVTLGRTAHTYDVRSGRYLGHVDQFTTDFQPDRGKLYARLPYAVRELTVRPNKPKARAGDTVELQLGLATDGGVRPGRHWVHLEVSGPDGVTRPHYSRNVAMTDGKGRATVPLALNDATGIWRADVRDVASGAKSRTTFAVR